MVSRAKFVTFWRASATRAFLRDQQLALAQLAIYLASLPIMQLGIAEQSAQLVGINMIKAGLHVVNL